MGHSHCVSHLGNMLKPALLFVVLCGDIISACGPPPGPPGTTPCGLFDCCTKRDTKCQFPFSHTGYYDDGNGNPIIETRQHGACGVLIDQEAVSIPDTDFRCFDGDSLQQCDMIHEYQFGDFPIPLCLPGYIPPPPPPPPGK